MNFSALGLSDVLVKATSAQGYETPSPIQEQAIPHILQGRDVVAIAKTGTGKTAGFTLPLLEQLLSSKERARANQARTLILAPTRELAAQIGENIVAYSRYTEVRSAVVFGGVKINPQMLRLRKGVDILVATPGRLLDLYQNNAIKFDQLRYLVLDEADRMLDMGFIHDIRKIIKVLPPRRQNLLFSATFSDNIRELAQKIVRKPVEISVSPQNTTVQTVTQLIHPVDKKRKSELLLHLLKNNGWHQVLVFARTQHGTNRLTRYLEAKNIKASAIHGRKSQSARTKALADFKSGKVTVLVATDIAARGLDIDLLPQVVNFDLPNTPEDYVHRIGRTGRAGAEGYARSLVSADEHKQLSEIERLIQKRLKRESVTGFEPQNLLPDPGSSLKLPRVKKPKKNKKNSSHFSSHQSDDHGNRLSKNKKRDFKPKSATKANGHKKSDHSRTDGNSHSSRRKPAADVRKKTVNSKSSSKNGKNSHRIKQPLKSASNKTRSVQS